MNPLLILLALSAWPPNLEAVLTQEPVPTPIKAKAIITDQFGSPHPIRRESNQGMIVFSGKKSVCDDEPDSVLWSVLPVEYDTRKYQPNPLEFAIGLEGQDVTLTVVLSVAKGKTVDHIIQTIICGKGGVPPPEPIAKSLKLVVIEDQFNRRPETSAILEDRRFWDGLPARGHSYRIYGDNDPTPAGMKAITDIKKLQGLGQTFPQGGSYLLIQNAATSESLYSTVLPSTPDIESLIVKYSGVRP